jgi:acetylornithine/succinyldiaminopimelate/putrescine aminotransferase
MYLKRSIQRVDTELDILINENEEIKNKYKIARSVRGVGKQIAIYLLVISRGFTKIKGSVN